MTSAERAVCYCQAICANEQLEAATPLSRDELWQEGLGRKSLPEDAAVEETCVACGSPVCGGACPWWAQSRVGLAHNLHLPSWDGQGGGCPWLVLWTGFPVGLLLRTQEAHVDAVPRFQMSGLYWI